MKHLFLLLMLILAGTAWGGEPAPKYYKMVPDACWIELAHAAQEVEPYLSESVSITTHDLLYRTPAQQLREEADRMEKRDAAIRRFKKALKAFGPGNCECP
jgi:hypothetical protein